MINFKQLFYEETDDPFELIQDLPDTKNILKIITDLEDDKEDKKLQNNLTNILKKYDLKWVWNKKKSGNFIPIKIMEL